MILEVAHGREMRSSDPAQMELDTCLRPRKGTPQEGGPRPSNAGHAIALTAKVKQTCLNQRMHK